MVDATFAEFVEARYGDLLRTAYLLTGSQHAAEDLLQSCLLRTMDRWTAVEEPMAYLRRAMVNHRTTLWRRLRGAEVLSDEVPEVAGADGTDAVAERALVLAALARLPKRMRAVVVLRFWDDLSEAATAEILGCSVGSVKSQSSRGLARLRDLLGAPAPAGRGQ